MFVCATFIILYCVPAGVNINSIAGYNIVLTLRRSRFVDTTGPAHMDTSQQDDIAGLPADMFIGMFGSARTFATLRAQFLVHAWMEAVLHPSMRHWWLTAETVYDEHVRETGCGSCVPSHRIHEPLSEACMRSCIMRTREWDEQVTKHILTNETTCRLEEEEATPLWGILAHSVRMSEEQLRDQWRRRDAMWKAAFWQYVVRLTKLSGKVRFVLEKRFWVPDKWIRYYKLHIARPAPIAADRTTGPVESACAQSDLQRVCATLDRALELIEAQTGSQRRQTRGRARRHACRDNPGRFRGTNDRSDSTLSYDLVAGRVRPGVPTDERAHVYHPPPMPEMCMTHALTEVHVDDESDATIPYDIGNTVSVDDDDDAGDNAGDNAADEHTTNSAHVSDADAHDTS